MTTSCPHLRPVPGRCKHCPGGRAQLTAEKPHGNTNNRNAAGKGRPPVPAEQRRVGMQISVTPAQRDEIKRRAAEAGMTITEWLLDGRL